MNYGRLLVGSFVVCLFLIGWNEIQDQQTVPRPSRFVSAGVVFVLLGVISMLGAPNLAAAFGVGVDVALLYQFNWANESKPDVNAPNARKLK